MSLHRNKIARFRVAGFLPAFTGPNFKCSKTAQLDDLIFLQAFFDFLKELINRMDIGSVDPVLLIEVFRSLGQFRFAMLSPQFQGYLRLGDIRLLHFVEAKLQSGFLAVGGVLVDDSCLRRVDQLKTGRQCCAGTLNVPGSNSFVKFFYRGFHRRLGRTISQSSLAVLPFSFFS